MEQLTQLLNALNGVLQSIADLAGAEGPIEELAQEDARAVTALTATVVGVFERLNDRYLDEIRSYDALNGVLLGAVVATYILFIDKVDAFSWWSVLALAPAFMVAILNFRGQARFSPDPEEFARDFEADPEDALKNLAADLQANSAWNGVLRNRKRKGLRWVLGLLIMACLVAGGFKVVHSAKGESTNSHVQVQSGRPAGEALKGGDKVPTSLQPGAKHSKDVHVQSKSGAQGSSGRGEREDRFRQQGKLALPGRVPATFPPQKP